MDVQPAHHLVLIWHDVVHMYKCHSLVNLGYYLKS